MKMFGPVEHNYAMGWRFKWDKLSAQDDARGRSYSGLLALHGDRHFRNRRTNRLRFLSSQ